MGPTEMVTRSLPATERAENPQPHFWELQFRWMENTGRCKVHLDSMGIKGKEMQLVVGLGWRENGDKNAVFKTQMCLNEKRGQDWKPVSSRRDGENPGQGITPNCRWERRGCSWHMFDRRLILGNTALCALLGTNSTRPGISSPQVHITQLRLPLWNRNSLVFKPPQPPRERKRKAREWEGERAERGDAGRNEDQD